MNAATALPHELDLQKFVLNQSSLIEASAGTGKTYTITYLVLRLLLGSGSAATALPQGPLEMNQLLPLQGKSRIRSTVYPGGT